MEDMLQPMKIACTKASPGVAGVDRTFYLREVFVIVMVFKQPAVIRKTYESPIFI